MTVQLAFLRAVNLAGHNKVGMSDLRDLLAELKLERPRTLLQSGNLVFESQRRTSAQLESLLEGAATRRLGLTTDFFVRTAKEWAAIVAGNPFRAEASKDPGHLVVLLLKKAATTTAVAALQEAITGREVVRGAGRHAYIVYPDGIGRSRLTLALIERKLGTRGTARNWNTVLKLGALARS